MNNVVSSLTIFVRQIVQTTQYHSDQNVVFLLLLVRAVFVIYLRAVFARLNEQIDATRL